ncbi:MAG: DUF1287 domain-containing protein [Verrucomicrobiales bacterium]|nr:DUF1287 domain-containing protein [Verrucomicrobiales bacterium]
MKYVSIILFCVWVLAEMLSAQEGAVFAERIVAAANYRTTQSVRYDPAYVVLSYPGGDVPADTGVCTDVVIRSYRSLGLDLQELVHEDMRAEFSAYPRLWGLKRPDRNIDHRRVPNLQRFLERQGAEVKGKGASFLPGDLVAWDLTGKGLWHIGVVTGADTFVHNIGSGPVTESGIRQWKIIGHYRWNGPKG